MALNSVLRRASKSFLPLAIRTVGSPRTFNRAIPTVFSVESRTALRNFLPFSHFSTKVTAQKPTGDDAIRVLETEIDCTEEPQDERKSGLRNESSKTKRIVLFQRITAALLLPLIIIYKKVSSIILPNLFLFRHINQGIEEIMADYVHQEMTRNWILIYLRLFLLIVVKDVFLSFI